METEKIKNIILDYCDGIVFPAFFDESDLPEMVERISGELLKSTDLFSILVAAFKAGEELGQANAKNIYRTTYPKEDVNEAAPEYATKILSENAKLNRRSDYGTN